MRSSGTLSRRAKTCRRRSAWTSRRRTPRPKLFAAANLSWKIRPAPRGSPAKSATRRLSLSRAPSTATSYAALSSICASRAISTPALLLRSLISGDRAMFETTLAALSKASPRRAAGFARQLARTGIRRALSQMRPARGAAAGLPRRARRPRSRFCARRRRRDFPRADAERHRSLRTAWGSAPRACHRDAVAARWRKRARGSAPHRRRCRRRAADSRRPSSRRSKFSLSLPRPPSSKTAKPSKRSKRRPRFSTSKPS